MTIFQRHDLGTCVPHARQDNVPLNSEPYITVPPLLLDFVILATRFPCQVLQRSMMFRAIDPATQQCPPARECANIDFP